MTEKRFWLSVLMIWTIIFLTDWIFHGVWMAGLYQQTAHLWRPMEEMSQTMWVMWVGHVFFAWAFVWIFTKGMSKDKPWGQAFRYALAMFSLGTVPRLLGQWAVSPYPTDIIFRWFIIEAIQVCLCAFALTWAYKTKMNFSHA